MSLLLTWTSINCFFFFVLFNDIVFTRIVRSRYLLVFFWRGIPGWIKRRGVIGRALQYPIFSPKKTRKQRLGTSLSVFPFLFETSSTFFNPFNYLSISFVIFRLHQDCRYVLTYIMLHDLAIKTINWRSGHSQALSLTC